MAKQRGIRQWLREHILVCLSEDSWRIKVKGKGRLEAMELCFLTGVIEQRTANCSCQETMIQTVDQDRPPSPDVMLPFDPVLFQHF